MPTLRCRTLGTVGSCVLLAAGVSQSAAAQTRASEGVYVSVSALADVKRFSGDVATNVLNGTAAGVAVAAGVPIGRQWDLEVSVDGPASTEKLQPRIVTFQRSTFTFQSKTTNGTVSVAALLRLRTGRHNRVRIGYVAGVSFVRFRRRFEAQATPDVPVSLIPKAQELVDYGAAPTLGADADVAVAGRVSIVPEFRATAFSFRDGSGVLLSPRVGVRWTF